jgi:hypothetical protein
MKRKLKNSILIASRVSPEIFEMLKILREKHCINFSELVRVSIINKYKELESE